MLMKVVNLYSGGFYSNTYVVGEEGQPCLIIDFGDNRNERLFSYVNRHHSKLEGILLTHGHFDHLAGFKETALLPCPVYLGFEDERCLNDGHFNASSDLLGEEITFPNLNPCLISNNDDLIFPDFRVKVIATPFHTCGSVCFYFENEKVLFSGDTLFHLGIGRDDLRGSCPKEKSKSLKKLISLPQETIVYPGHGPKTTIGNELAFNPYLS